MSIIYYLSVILFTFGLPALLVLFTIGLVRPNIVNRLTRRDWSRKRLAGIGVSLLSIGTIGLAITIDGTMPQNVRAEIAAQQKAEAAAKTKLETAKLAAEKLQNEKRALASKPITKVETVKLAITYTSSEKEETTLAKGTRKTTTAGLDGEKTETYEVTYINNKETARKLTKTEVTKQPINEVISVGTYVAPVATPQPSPQPAYVTSPAPSTYYANCSAARSAGAAPIYKGQPGYSLDLDRDRDGIACE